jgi:hypothetical protein
MSTGAKPTTTVKVAATQFAPSRKLEENLVKGEALVREAARQGAQVCRVCTQKCGVLVKYSLYKAANQPFFPLFSSPLPPNP